VPVRLITRAFAVYGPRTDEETGTLSETVFSFTLFLCWWSHMQRIRNLSRLLADAAYNYCSCNYSICTSRMYFWERVASRQIPINTFILFILVTV